MQLFYGKNVYVLSVDPCGVCAEWVGWNYTGCIKKTTTKKQKKQKTHMLSKLDLSKIK